MLIGLCVAIELFSAGLLLDDELPVIPAAVDYVITYMVLLFELLSFDYCVSC